MIRFTDLPFSLFAVLLLLLTALPGQAVAQSAQQEPQETTPQAAQQELQPAVRATGTTVVVDAVVVDGDNRVIKDLTKDDFVLVEDDVRQQIDAVILRSGLPPATDAERQTRASSPRPRSWDSQVRPPNFIVFMLDYASTEFQNQHLVERAAVRYVENHLQPDDFAAVFAVDSGFRLVQPFTNDVEKLKEAFKVRSASGQAKSRSAQNTFNASNADLLRAGNFDPAQLELGIETGGDFSSLSTAAAAAFSEAGRLLLALRIEQLRVNMGAYLNKRQALSVLSAIQAVAQAFREVEGRKSLILFSQGFVVGSEAEAEFHRTIEMASLARLAVYGLDPQGLLAKQNSGDLLPSDQLSSISAANGRNRILASGGQSIFDRARETGSDTRDSALRYLAGATGGFALRNSNDLYPGLERIDEDLRSHFLIFYRPSNQSLDGRFREIRLSIRGRNDLEVRHRMGYRAVPRGLETLSDEEVDMMLAAQQGTLDTDLPVFLRTDTFHLDAAPQEVLVTIDLPTEEIEFLTSEADGRVEGSGVGYVARLMVLGLVRDKSGEIIRRLGLPVSIRASAQDYEELLRGGLSISQRLDLLPGDYSVQVLVKDLTNERLGLMERSLRVPARPEGLAFSTIVLGEQVERSNNRPGGLVADGIRILPSARRQFRSGERLVYYLEVYNADPASAPEVEIALQRSGSPEQMALPAEKPQGTAESGHLTLARYIELGQLAPGAYNLIAQSTDPATGQTVQSRTMFRIVE
ncbi:MAG TPA: VWA domain-containing protein [Acidobacteriota bacterium]|nr:VWA domain-containing protein [Acidobacteriota bacterium]